MPTERDIIKRGVESSIAPNVSGIEPKVGDVPLDQFVAQERTLRQHGYTALHEDDGTGYGNKSPYRGPLYTNGQESKSHVLYPPAPLRVSDHYAWNTSVEDAVITGDVTHVGDNAQILKAGQDIEEYVVTALRQRYDTEKLTDFGVLQGLEKMDPEERNNRILYEANRMDYAKTNTKHLLAIHMMRNGFGSLPQRAIDQIWQDMSPSQLEQLRENYRQGQLDDLQREIDIVAAQQGEGFTTGVAVGEILRQDIAPFYGAITRVITTNKFLPDDVEMSSIRKALPGEVRQEIREWFADASQEERMEYVNGIREEFEKLRKGPYSAHFTRYGVVENLMGVFTEDLLQDNMPTDRLDRWLGNLDTLLGGVIAVGTVVKRGVSVTGLFKSRNVSSARNAAQAAGNRQATDALDIHINNAAEQFELAPGEVAVPDLPRPAHLKDRLEVAPDSVKQVISRAEPRRKRVLDNLNDVTGLGLNDADKARVTRNVIDELTQADGVHANSRMTTVERLQDDTGIRVTVNYGQSPGHGWSDFGDLVEDLLDLDPNLETFRVMRRTAQGIIEPVDLTPLEIAQFATKGVVPAVVEQGLDSFSASTRLFGGRKLSQVSNRELLDVAQTLEPDSPDLKNILDTLDLRNSGETPADVLTMLDGDEFYLQRSQDRFWSTIDKEDLNNAFTHTWAPQAVLSPNMKFSDDVFGAFNRAYLKEQATRGDFSELVKPFSTLSRRDKREVEGIFEWAEDFAKDMHEATGEARAPDWAEIVDRFPEATDSQLAGYAAVRTAMDLQYEIFNRRLYRNWLSQGFVTARSVDGSAPNYHGAEVARGSARQAEYFDPYTGEAKFLDQDAIEDLYANGGTLLRLDLAVDGPPGAGQFDTIIVRSGSYEVGELSKTPLNYYAGYTMRFYEDPIYVVKHTTNARVNGKVVEGESGVTEAIRTAGSSAEGRRFLRRLGTSSDSLGRRIDNKNPNIRYELVRAKNLNTQEGTLYQQQALYREGRLFWDTRQRTRLPDVNGNKAKIEDIQQTLEKGTALALRQATHEDLFKTIKNAIGHEYADLIPASKLATDDVTEILTDLRRGRREATSKKLRQRYTDAIGLVKYLQTQMGTDSFLVPWLREAMVRLSDGIGSFGSRIGNNWLGRRIERLGGIGEDIGASVDPFQSMRKVGWYSFMVFRPVRQLLLQSFQISYLTALDPAYIGTGRVFKDALALRRGWAHARRAGFDDGWSNSKMAKIMGVSQKEYKRIVEEFNRSGLLDTVNVHSFNPRAGAAGKAKLNTDTLAGRFMYHARVRGRAVTDTFQAGFDIGEQNNLTFTYMVALRRALKDLDKTATQLSRQEWDKVAQEASNLALAMTRPNKFAYQSGAWGVTTQFISFSHKATLGLFGLNPAISRKDGLKIALTTYLLFGSNLFGAEDWTREQLAKMGLSNKAEDEILPGVSLQDLLAAGAIESAFNAIGDATFEEWKDLDVGVFAPGANIVDIYQTALEAAVEGIGPEAFAGPSGTPIAGIMKGLKFTSMNWNNDTRAPAQKFLDSASLIIRETFPAANDANRAWYAYQMGVWLDKDGDTLPLQPTMNAIIARGFTGIRPEDELALYRMKYLHWKEQENIENAITANKTYLKQILTSWSDGIYDDDTVYTMVGSLMSMYEDAPEGVRREIYTRSLIDGTFDNPSVVSVIAEFANSGTSKIESVIPWINMQQDMTQEQKDMMIQYVREVQAGYKGADERFQQLHNQDRNIN